MLSSILPNLISPEQKGFVAGRNIKDEICLASEAINLLSNKSFNGNVTLKIDITKAFDSLNCNFLLKTLTAFGFNSKFCSWIHTLLNYANLFIGLNGNQVGYFNCSNGVRQGGPLSPLLFYLAEDIISIGISKLVQLNQINLIQANKHYRVPSHSFFADDIMIFCRGNVKSLTTISNLLKDNASCSGQICNPIKSIIYAEGMSQERHNSLASIIGFSIDYPPFIYLGVPIFIGKPKAKYFDSLADNIKLKLATWKAKMLSMAGRLLLVNL